MNPYIVGGTAIVILGMGWALKSSYERNGELEQKLKNQVTETEEAVAANESNQQAIRRLESRIETMLEERRLEAERRDQVIRDRDIELQVLLEDNERLRKEREEALNENPDCADLASLSIDYFCPTVGAELRERSRGPSSN